MTASPSPPEHGLRRYRGAAHLAAGPLLLNVISLPVSAYIIRTLGQKAYGQWAAAAALVATTTFLTNLGLRGLFVRSVSRHPETAESALADQLALRTVLSVAAGITAVALSVLLRHGAVVTECAAVAGLGLVLATLGTTFGDLFQARERLSRLAGVTFVGGLLLTITSVIVVWLRGGAVALSVAYVVGPLVISLLAWRLVRRDGVHVRWHMAARRSWALLVDARWYGLQQAAGAVGVNAEALIVPKVLGVEAFGLYAAGALLTNRLSYLTDALGVAAFPAISREAANGEVAAAAEASGFVRLALASCVPVAILVTWLATPVAWILCPANVAAGRFVVAATVWSVPIQGLVEVMGYGLNGIGHDRLQARLATIGNLGGTAAVGLLVWRFGIYGACISPMVRALVHLLLRVPDFSRAFPRVLAGVPVARLAVAIVGFCVALAVGQAAARGLVRADYVSAAYPATRHVELSVWLGVLTALCVVSAAGAGTWYVAATRFGLIHAPQHAGPAANA